MVKGYRNPTIREMYMFSCQPGIETGKLINYELSYSQRLLEGLSYGISLTISMATI